MFQHEDDTLSGSDFNIKVASSSQPPSPTASTTSRGLSPLPHYRPTSSLSRPSSRSSARSVRTHSPSVSRDDPIAVRNQISSLKHSIRHQQAQVTDLQNKILQGPRPYNTDDSSVMSVSPSPQTPTKSAKRSSSYEVLYGIAGPDSSLPLPTPPRPHSRPRLESNGSITLDDSIQEGIPADFVTSSPGDKRHFKRPSSPTRTMSRIPVSAVGNAKALADEGRNDPASLSTSSLTVSGLSLPPNPNSAPNTPTSSPANRRFSLTPGGTTKVLADLQTGVVNARNALENTKAQLRLSQRSVAQLTRQTEDLKEGRERLRLENEGLNNVVARKERLLQEVLERARKAEAEANTLKGQLKTETTTSKKAMREMESALAESTALSSKSEREYLTLRDSMKSMTESWKADNAALRTQMTKREEKLRRESDEIGKKYNRLLEGLKERHELETTIQNLREEDSKKNQELEDFWTKELESLKEELAENERKGNEAAATAKETAGELARIRRLMQKGAPS